MNYSVRQINGKDTHYWLLNIHYAKRLPSITFAFGLYRDDLLVGVVTYGSPPNKTQRVGVAGNHWGCWVLELNRLCLTDNLKHEASMLVGRSLKMLPDEWIIISYADRDGQGHDGIVYQATNFLYCGLTAKRSNWRIKGMEHLHSTTLPDRFKDYKAKGYGSKLEYAKAYAGDDFYYEHRPRKHRYIFIKGGKRFKKQVLADLKYKQEKYPDKLQNREMDA